MVRYPSGLAGSVVTTSAVQAGCPFWRSHSVMAGRPADIDLERLEFRLPR